MDSFSVFLVLLIFRSNLNFRNRRFRISFFRELISIFDRLEMKIVLRSLAQGAFVNHHFQNRIDSKFSDRF